MCTDTIWSEFAFVLFRQIYSYCEEWLEHNKENRDPALEYNIQTLMHFVHPMRWRAGGSPKKSDVDIITTLLVSIYAPVFREKAPELWEKIDSATLTFAIYSTPDFKGMGSDGTVIEAAPKIPSPQPPQSKDVPPGSTISPPTATAVVEEEHVDDKNDDSVDGFKLKRQRNFEPEVKDPIEILNETVEEVEHEELNEGNDDDDDDEENDDNVVVEDDEILKTPFAKRREVSPTPRYNLRTTKIIVWNPATQNKKH